MSAAHEALGVPVGATAADIKKAYRRLSRQHHPDTLPPEASAAERKAAAHRFSTINSAYEQLSPEKKQQRERQEQERRQQKKQAQEQQKKQQAQEERERQERERQERERQRARQQQERQGQERQGQGQGQGQEQGQERQGQGSTGPAGFIPLWMRERLAQAALNVGEVVAQQGEAAVRDLGHTGVDKGVDYLRRLFSPKP